MTVPAPATARFDLFGEVSFLAKASTGVYVPSRPLGGWLATYGKILPNGGVIPTVDREGHNFEAASTLGRIDFSDYLAKGKWNDTHTSVIVGLPTGLEFHDEHTDLAKAHRKVGFWTEGHLFDRADPRSWTMFGSYDPTSKDLDRADHFWHLATMLKGMPRPLGFSAHGKMILSPCKTRIIWARVEENAVCEVPMNPDASALPLRLAVPDGTVLSPEMVGKAPCATCRCPAGARCKVADARKSVTAATIPAPEDLEGAANDDEKTEDDRVVELLVAKHGLTPAHARTWLNRWGPKRPKETA